MERVKHIASPRKWNQRSLCASGRVAIERVGQVGQWDSFHDKSRGWGRLERTYLWVSSLYSGKDHSRGLTRQKGIGFDL